MPIFIIFGKPVSLLEILATITGLLNVYLLIKNKVSNWFWGAVCALLSGIVLWQAKLFSDMGLQLLYFVPMQFYGWYLWTRGTPEKNDDLPITISSPTERWAWVAATLGLSFGWGWFMAHYTQAAIPYADALNMGASIVAQYLQAKRKLESWWYWLAIDVLTTFYRYPSQELYFFTGLYAIFTVMAFMGAREWAKLMRLQREREWAKLMRLQREQREALAYRE